LINIKGKIQVFVKNQIKVYEKESTDTRKIPQHFITVDDSCKVISSAGEVQVMFLKGFFSKNQVEVLCNTV
jgi:hypothetical protein